jgi:hypothetical protein
MNSKDAYIFILQEIEDYKKQMVRNYGDSDDSLIQALRGVLEEAELEAMVQDLSYLQQVLGLIALARHQAFLMDINGNLLQEIFEDEDEDDEDYHIENCEVM